MTSIRLKIEESWYASMDCKVQKSGPWVCFYGGHSTGYKLGNHPKNIEPCAHRARTVRAPCAHRATTPPMASPAFSSVGHYYSWEVYREVGHMILFCIPICKLHSTSPPVWNHGHHRSYRIVVTVNAYTCSDEQTGSVQVLDWFQPPIFCPLQGRG